MHETHYQSDPVPEPVPTLSAGGAAPTPATEPGPAGFPGTEAIQDVTAVESSPPEAEPSPDPDRPARRAGRAKASLAGAAGTVRRLPWDVRLKIAVVLSFV